VEVSDFLACEESVESVYNETEDSKLSHYIQNKSMTECLDPKLHESHVPMIMSNSSLMFNAPPKMRSTMATKDEDQDEPWYMPQIGANHAAAGSWHKAQTIDTEL
jgi:hypothetical protein